MHDYSDIKDDETPKAGSNLMGALIDLSDQLVASETEVARLEELLTEAKANVRRLCEHEIPKLMDGLDGTFNLPDGRKITITEKVRASIGGDKKPIAMRWLDEHGHGSIIKRKFTIEFGKEQEDWAKEFEKQLKDSPTPLNMKKERTVAWQTLDAFVREQLAEGSDIPLDIFGVYRQRIAKVKED